MTKNPRPADWMRMSPRQFLITLFRSIGLPLIVLIASLIITFLLWEYASIPLWLIATACFISFFLFAILFALSISRERAIWYVKGMTQKLRQEFEDREQFLSAIPSILIGVDENDIITHWNRVAEGTFGFSEDSVRNKKLSECGIPCNTKQILMGIQACRNKKEPVRLDDISFKRPNGQEGFLGIKIIPVHRSHQGKVHALLFGADITERRRNEELKNEFVSTVSHELRTPLTIIKEGVSQVHEGILGSLNEQQQKFLGISLDGISRLGRIVDELLDISKIEAGKFDLRRENIDVAALAKKIANEFSSSIKERGLQLKMECPEDEVNIYADRDRVAQVFINLIVNAMKFTEKGTLGISIKDSPKFAECSVWDTGRGIEPENLPKVFGKFQQFGQPTASAERGTGLGLAICKGIVESHQGEIRVESHLGRGTRFTFMLPKYNTKELFIHHVKIGLRNAVRQDSFYSLILANLQNVDTSFLHSIENLIRQSLREQGGTVIRDTHSILVLLPAAGKDESMGVARRIEEVCHEFLARQAVNAKMSVVCSVASFPEDGNTEEKLLSKAGGQELWVA